jgi:hypothetical protein
MTTRLSETHLERRHRLAWAALVIGCAAPVAATIWRSLDAQGHLGMAMAVACWIAAIVPIEKAIQRRQSTDASRYLMLGAAVFMVIEVLGWLAFHRFFVFALFIPAVYAAIPLEFVIDSTTSDFLPAFIMTTLCGGQALACAFLFGRAINLVSRQPAVQRGTEVIQRGQTI